MKYRLSSGLILAPMVSLLIQTMVGNGRLSATNAVQMANLVLEQCRAMSVFRLSAFLLVPNE